MNFNSIKVQLELLLKERALASTVFQFHKGTIRTRLPTVSSRSTLNFNSIKVQLERQQLHFRRQDRRNFNSIKVQLEPFTEKSAGGLQSNFNSIKVQLEPWSAQRPSLGSRFQFHKGTIRTLSTFFAFFGCDLFQFHKGTIRTH